MGTRKESLYFDIGDQKGLNYCRKQGKLLVGRNYEKKGSNYRCSSVTYAVNAITFFQEKP